MSVRRFMMMRSGATPKEYVDIFRSTFPTNGNTSGRNYLYIYTNGTIPSGTEIHLSFALSEIPSSLTYIKVSQTNSETAANIVAAFYPSFDNLDAEFTISRNILYITLFFSENVTLQVSQIVLQKIVYP